MLHAVNCDQKNRLYEHIVTFTGLFRDYPAPETGGVSLMDVYTFMALINTGAFFVYTYNDIPNITINMEKMIKEITS